MTWEISGRYMETCNCDFVCPCILTGLAETTHGDCRFAMAYSVERGNFDGVDLAGTKFLIVGYTPGAMSEGNWKVGLIADDAASKEQTEALTAIVSGQSGGPIANIAPLIGEFAGVESRPVRFEGSGSEWSVFVDGLVDQAVEGARGLAGETMELDNVAHPAANRVALARATKSHIHAFGIDFDNSSGGNNGHFAPFSWSG